MFTARWQGSGVSDVICDEVFLRRPTVALLVKKFLPFIGISASLTVFAKARHCPLHGYFFDIPLNIILPSTSRYLTQSVSSSSRLKASTVFSFSMRTNISGWPHIHINAFTILTKIISSDNPQFKSSPPFSYFSHYRQMSSSSLCFETF